MCKQKSESSRGRIRHASSREVRDPSGRQTGQLSQSESQGDFPTSQAQVPIGVSPSARALFLQATALPPLALSRTFLPLVCGGRDRSSSRARSPASSVQVSGRFLNVVATQSMHCSANQASFSVSGPTVSGAWWATPHRGPVLGTFSGPRKFLECFPPICLSTTLV